METEDGEALPAADATAAHLGAERVGGVLDQHETAGAGQALPRVQVARLAGEVHGHQRARARRERGGGGGRVEREGVRAHVGEDRPGALVEDGV